MVSITYFGYFMITFPATVEITPGETIRELITRLLDGQNLTIEEFFDEHIVVKNGSNTNENTPVYDGDKVNIFPPSTMG